jgi:hypothetical protein
MVLSQSLTGSFYSGPSWNMLLQRTAGGEPWIQVVSATTGLKASISSAIASAGVLQPRVFLGLLFSSAATSFSHVLLFTNGIKATGFQPVHFSVIYYNLPSHF